MKLKKIPMAQHYFAISTPPQQGDSHWALGLALVREWFQANLPGHFEVEVSEEPEDPVGNKAMILVKVCFDIAGSVALSQTGTIHLQFTLDPAKDLLPQLESITEAVEAARKRWAAS